MGSTTQSLSSLVGGIPNTSTSSHMDRSERLARARRERTDAEYRLQAVEMMIATTEAELAALERLSVTSLLSRISGEKSAKVHAVREALAAQEAQRHAAIEALDALRIEVVRLQGPASESAEAGNRKCGLVADAATEIAASPRKEAAGVGGVSGTGARDGPARRDGRGPENAAHAEEGGRERVENEERARMLRRVAESCDEARKDLLSEVETVSSLFRCRADMRSQVLGLLGKAARKATIEQCAGRVRSSMGRLLRRVDEAFEQLPPESPEWPNALEELRGVARDFSADWMRESAESARSWGAAQAAIELVGMHIERELARSKR